MTSGSDVEVKLEPLVDLDTADDLNVELRVLLEMVESPSLEAFELLRLNRPIFEDGRFRKGNVLPIRKVVKV